MLTSLTPPTLGEIIYFAGGFIGGAGLITLFLGDQSIALASSVVALQKVVQRSSTFATLAVYVPANTLLANLTVQTARDGAATGPIVTIGAGATGLFTNVAALAMTGGVSRIDIVAVSNAGVNLASIGGSVLLQ